jgi:hypothetical protein
VIHLYASDSPIVFVESIRIVMIQILLQGFGLTPLVSLYYMAPIVLCCNLVVILPIEGMEALWMAAFDVGPLILLGNALLTFGLNLSSVWLIGKASGLTLTLSGVLKDSALFIRSVKAS